LGEKTEQGQEKKTPFHAITMPQSGLGENGFSIDWVM
jgi:hypothetical protein